MKVGLVGCVKTKLSSGTAAQDLYVSPLFIGRREYVERTCDTWYVLSALHGLLQPEQRIEPYDVTLTRMGIGERRSWAGRVLSELDTALGGVAGHHFEIHAGAAYSDFGLSVGLHAAGASVSAPTAGLPLGAQLAFYRDARVRLAGWSS